MITAEVETPAAELKKLNTDLVEYQKLSRKLPQEVIEKQSKEFSFRLFKELQTIRPGKGTIRAQAYALFGTGRGVLVRESVRQAVFARYKAASEIKTRGLKIQRRGKGVTSTMVKGKRLNIQALLVQAELNVREKGAGFLSISSRFPRGDGGRGEDYSESIFGQRLGAKYLTAMGDSAQARFVWGEEGPLSLSAATGLSKDRARDVVARAIAATRANMLEYTRRKQKEAVEKIGKS